MMVLYGDALSKGKITVKKALTEFLEKEMRGEYIGKKSGKPRALITAEHDVETANALLFPCKGLMSLQVNKVTAGHISQWKTWINEKKYKKAGILLI